MLCSKDRSTHQCKVGSHWNDHYGKCMPVPESLRQHISQANASSHQARASGEKGDHYGAHRAHQEVAHLAAGEGFSHIAKKHRRRSNFHLGKSNRSEAVEAARAWIDE